MDSAGGAASSVSDIRGEKVVRRGSWARVCDGANAVVVVIAREMARMAARVCLGNMVSVVCRFRYLDLQLMRWIHLDSGESKENWEAVSSF